MRPSAQDHRGLARRLASSIEVRSAGLGFALLGVVIAVVLFGLAPTTLGLGLVALLVVD
jgi:hypothetical protein